MSEIFKALESYKPPKKKVHTVTINGQSVVVTLEKKLEVMRHGEDAYMWKTATEFVLKPQPKITSSGGKIEQGVSKPQTPQQKTVRDRVMDYGKKKGEDELMKDRPLQKTNKTEKNNLS